MFSRFTNLRQNKEKYSAITFSILICFVMLDLELFRKQHLRYHCLITSVLITDEIKGENEIKQI